jgi:hypothetical protein
VRVGVWCVLTLARASWLPRGYPLITPNLVVVPQAPGHACLTVLLVVLWVWCGRANVAQTPSTSTATASG